MSSVSFISQFEDFVKAAEVMEIVDRSSGSQDANAISKLINKIPGVGLEFESDVAEEANIEKLCQKLIVWLNKNKETFQTHNGYRLLDRLEVMFDHWIEVKFKIADSGTVYYDGLEHLDKFI